ncbi:YfcL family protein [Balneatrix alpica]|uniref:YfcL family protein n=1 Tax=Balneatrix alpica TaxID=75684 RepID=A0ABV5ZBY3_9GAMM|nr:YfcL family protein [Balneatrix alpica]
MTSAFVTYGDDLDAKLRILEEQAADDQLFAYAYLMGHLGLITCQELETVAQYNQLMEQALAEGFAVDHLSEDDKTLINQLWQQLKQPG